MFVCPSGITPEQLNEFSAQFIRKVHVEGLMFGNLTRERALSVADTIENKLPKDATPLLAQQLLLYREVEIEKGECEDTNLCPVYDVTLGSEREF
ncbi:jg26621 [Pararge aegeria aegeria]|uniref:Jg26621 protein n=1 Tax=Pararge aegeria aegeria TaxID=348720 RepID=A0A8S4R0S9_9NEOP|nr:jg26621 [Pararge aegeria aegeria]